METNIIEQNLIKINQDILSLEKRKKIFENMLCLEISKTSDNNIVEFNKVLGDIKFISSDEAYEIFNNMENRIGLFIVKEEKVYCAIDNSSKEAFTEEFYSLSVAISWLNGDFEVDGI